MNPITDIVFSLTWILLLIWAIRSASKGWNAMPQNNTRPSGMWTTQVRKAVHPEMVNVEPGTELMGVNFEENQQVVIWKSTKLYKQGLKS